MGMYSRKGTVHDDGRCIIASLLTYVVDVVPEARRQHHDRSLNP